MLDKNPRQIEKQEFVQVKKRIEENTINSILCKEPFVKASFLLELIKQVNYPILYLDFDLLYSGFATSEMISVKENVSLYRPTKSDWNEVLKTRRSPAGRKIFTIVVNRRVSINGSTLLGKAMSPRPSHGPRALPWASTFRPFRPTESS